jgi:hypothetical protein
VLVRSQFYCAEGSSPLHAGKPLHIFSLGNFTHRPGDPCPYLCLASEVSPWCLPLPTFFTFWSFFIDFPVLEGVCPWPTTTFGAGKPVSLGQLPVPCAGSHVPYCRPRLPVLGSQYTTSSVWATLLIDLGTPASYLCLVPEVSPRCRPLPTFFTFHQKSCEFRAKSGDPCPLPMLSPGG